MDSSTYLIIQINELTALISSKYPELYQFLEEQPLTLKSPKKNKEMDKKLLCDYLENLNQLLKHHVTLHENV